MWDFLTHWTIFHTIASWSGGIGGILWGLRAMAPGFFDGVGESFWKWIKSKIFKKRKLMVAPASLTEKNLWKWVKQVNNNLNHCMKSHSTCQDKLSKNTIALTETRTELTMVRLDSARRFTAFEKEIEKLKSVRRA